MMASVPAVLIAAVAATLFFGLIGAAIERGLALRFTAPGGAGVALGWAVFTPLALPVQSLIGFSRVSTGGLVLLAVVASVAVLIRVRAVEPDAPPAPLRPLAVWAYALAALIALIPLAALLPRHVDGGVILGWTVSDHSKAAMIDEMTRLGLPAGNPFFGAHGARGLLSYYYLWHFGAAQLSLLLGISGWEADAAMTGVTAFAALTLMMGLAGWFAALLAPAEPRFASTPVSEPAAEPPPRPPPPLLPSRTPQNLAVVFVALLSLAGTLHPILALAFGPARLGRMLASYRDLEPWMTQASWVPQHMASAYAAVLAALVLIGLLDRPSAKVLIGRVVLTGALAAAALGSSVWVGGVAFAAIAAGIGLMVLVRERGAQLLWFALAALAAALAALLALPLLTAEFATLAARHGGPPIAVHPFEVIGSLQPRGLRRILDLPAYWLALLPVDLPAIYPAGVATFVLYFRRARRFGGASPQALGLAVLTGASLAVSWLLVSTIGNNDLGWRALLPAILVLTPVAAAGLARWTTLRAYAPLLAALLLLAASLPDRTAIGNLTGKASDDASDFAEAPALWSAVRRYAGPDDRVANDPLYLDDIAGYPVNISWALLSNRPSCYSGWETARAYVDLPQKQIAALDAQFIRVFAGKAAPDDVRQLAQDYGCRLAVVTDSDGAWTNDPFAASPYFTLAETADDWKIYRAVEAPLPATSVRTLAGPIK